MSGGSGNKAVRSPKPPRLKPRRAASPRNVSDREVCPKCGRPNARLIGRSETFPVLYLRCDDCNHTSVAPA